MTGSVVGALRLRGKHACNVLVKCAHARGRGRSVGREDPLEQKIATHSSILLGTSHGQRSLVGYRPCGCKRVRYDFD